MKKTELFQLIKSLSKSEKRYFKLFCNQMGGAANYVRLFDAMDAQEGFDEDAIREKFHGEKMLRQLHVTKNYLRQLILKALRNYHSKFSKDAELKDMLRNVEILFHKELYNHCQTELRRAEKMAQDFELKTSLVDVITWKRKVEQALRPQNYKAFHQILLEQDKALEKLKNVQSYWHLAVDVSSGMLDRRGSWKGVESPLLKFADRAQSLEAKVLYFNTLYVHYLQKGKSEKAAEALEELVTYLEGFPHRIQQDPGCTFLLSTTW